MNYLAPGRKKIVGIFIGVALNVYINVCLVGMIVTVDSSCPEARKSPL